MSFSPLYIPVGVPTFHLESAQDQFERSCAMLRGVDPDFVCPDEMLLTLDKLRAYLDGLNPDLIVFQNLTFANAAYMAEVLRRYDCPMLLWTLREPVIDGGRLRLNSLTGAYSAANTLAAFDGRAFNWCFGAPEEESVVSAVKATVEAARVKKAMRSLTMSAIGHTPQSALFAPWVKLDENGYILTEGKSSQTSVPGRRNSSKSGSIRQPLKSPTSHIEVACGAHSRKTHPRFVR